MSSDRRGGLERKLGAVAGYLERLGGGLEQSLEDVHAESAAACLAHGVALERILADLWDRLGLRGSPANRPLQQLLQATSAELERRGTSMPRRVEDYARGIEVARKRAAHSFDAVEDGHGHRFVHRA